MRYLILAQTGRPLDERPTLESAEARIHKTQDVILFIPEYDGELSDTQEASNYELQR